MDAGNLYDFLGLSTAEGHVAAARERMSELFDQASRVARHTDRWWERFGDQTGLLTYHDVFAWTEELQEWAEEQFLEQGDDDERTDAEGEESPWWPRVVEAGKAVGAVAWYVWDKLDFPVTESEDFTWEIDGFEIDGIPWTVERLHEPGPPLAARVGEMMLHGGSALPGPGAGLGSGDVLIGGRGALTVTDVVAACPMTNIVGIPHIPQPGSWMTTNGSVFVNGQPLLRNGDWLMESPGGLNPLSGGAPTVYAGPPARPCMVEEVRRIGLGELVPGLETVGWDGATISFTGSVSWGMHDILKAIAAAGIVYGGRGNKVSMWVAGKLISTIDGPSVSVGVDIDLGELFGEFGSEHDRDGDGKRDRTRVEVDLPRFEAGDTVEVDPEDPSRAKKHKKTRKWKKGKQS